MNSKEALNNIAVEFDEMGMICSNIIYKDFWEKDLHFKDIFKTEYEIITQDLDRLEQLEKDGQVLMNKAFELSAKLTKIKKALDILKENLFIEFKQDGKYLMVKLKEDKEQECDYTIMLLDDKEEFNLLKEVLEDV